MNQAIQGQWTPVVGVLSPELSLSVARALRSERARVTGQTRHVDMVERDGTPWRFALSPERAGSARLHLYGQEQPIAAWKWSGGASTLGEPMRAAPKAYAGEAHRPWPPAPHGWLEVAEDDRGAHERAASVLGALPRWHFVDELRPTGLYRFFCYETPTGADAVGALRFVGEDIASTLGADVLTNPNNTPEIYAAQQLLDWLSVNGCDRWSDGGHHYVQTVADFQQAYNLSGLGPAISTDGDYGGNTQRAMQLVLDTVQPSGGQAPENCFPASSPYAYVPVTPGLNKGQPRSTQAQKTMLAGMSTGAVLGLTAAALTVGGVVVAAASGWNPFMRV